MRVNCAIVARRREVLPPKADEAIVSLGEGLSSTEEHRY